MYNDKWMITIILAEWSLNDDMFWLCITQACVHSLYIEIIYFGIKTSTIKQRLNTLSDVVE